MEPDVTPAPTPGQAARAAWRGHWDVASERGRGKPGWDSLAYEAEAWEVAAEAGNSAGLPRVLAEAARYKAERDRYRQALERCADEKYPGEAVTIARQALGGDDA